MRWVTFPSFPFLITDMNISVLYNTTLVYLPRIRLGPFLLYHVTLCAFFFVLPPEISEKRKQQTSNITFFSAYYLYTKKCFLSAPFENYYEDISCRPVAADLSTPNTYNNVLCDLLRAVSAVTNTVSMVTRYAANIYNCPTRCQRPRGIRYYLSLLATTSLT